MAKKSKKHDKQTARHIMTGLLGLLAIVLITPHVFHAVRQRQTLPPGIDIVSDRCRTTDLEVLIDSTAFDPQTGERAIEQQIFDRILEVIQGAERFIYVDFFLWNNWQGSIPEDHRALSSELADALIAHKKANPAVTILAFTDPINRIYGEDEPDFYARLADADIPVVFTDLDQLRDSNLVYSPYARFYGQLLGALGPVHRWFDRRAIKNPFVLDGRAIERRQAATLLHFKANHRKVVVADDGSGSARAIVMSFNPADGSSAHSNIGLLAAGPIALNILGIELESVAWSAATPGQVLENTPGLWKKTVSTLRGYVDQNYTPEPIEMGQPYVQYLTEEAIRRRIITMLDQSGPGDDVRIAIFYLSDRAVVRAIKDAAAGGANVRVIIDPNRDAFGRKKNGVPNRPVAAELTAFAADRAAKLKVRWADTHGEQFHTKALCISNPGTGKCQLLCGSANWTRRNLQNLNLEANLYLTGHPEPVNTFAAYFDKAWANQGKLRYTTDYDTYAETGFSLFRKKLLYRFQEASGLSTF